MLYEEIVSFVKNSVNIEAAKEVETHLSVEIDICGEGEGAFYVEVKEGTVNVEPYEYYDRDAKITITADELMRVLNGEKDPIKSFEEGNLLIDGNINSVQELLALIKKPDKKPATKKSTPKKSGETKSVKAEKKIVERSKKKDSKIQKDIKK